MYIKVYRYEHGDTTRTAVPPGPALTEGGFRANVAGVAWQNWAMDPRAWCSYVAACTRDGHAHMETIGNSAIQREGWDVQAI